MPPQPSATGELDHRRHLAEVSGLDDEVEPELASRRSRAEAPEESEVGEQRSPVAAAADDGVGDGIGGVGSRPRRSDPALKLQLLPGGGIEQHAIGLHLQLDARAQASSFRASGSGRCRTDPRTGDLDLATPFEEWERPAPRNSRLSRRPPPCGRGSVLAAGRAIQRCSSGPGHQQRARRGGRARSAARRPSSRKGRPDLLSRLGSCRPAKAGQ